MMLTPVEHREGAYFKRDDLYRPLATHAVNGGKLRQCISQVRVAGQAGVVSASSIHSPQSAIVAAVAQRYRKHCVLFVGGSRDTMPVRLARHYGADIRRLATGRHTVLFHHAEKVAREREYLLLTTGFAENDVLGSRIGATAHQVKNIPDTLDNMVVTCGSGASAIGILQGLSQFRKTVRTLFLVGTAPDRWSRISRALNQVRNSFGEQYVPQSIVYHNLFTARGFRYEREERFSFCGIKLHPLYEAKAFRWSCDQVAWRKERTLFWIIGGPLADLT